MKIKDMILAANEASGYGHFNTAGHSAIAQERYEAEMIEEARAIVYGDSDQLPTVEHLRLALEWLDGSSPRLAPGTDDDQPF